MSNSTEIREWFIYKITNPQGRVYIGRTLNMTHRLRSYKCKSSCKKQPLVWKSFEKYGFENHVFEIIDTFMGDNSYCNCKEMFWIRTYMSNIIKYPEHKGMNLTDGGGGSLGAKKSDEERAAMVKRYTGRKSSEKQKETARIVHKGNTYGLGRKQSNEEKEKRAAKLRGRKIQGIELDIRRSTQLKNNGKPIIVYDTYTGETKEFTHIKAAEPYVSMNRDTIGLHLRNKIKTKPLFKNMRYTFKYKEDVGFRQIKMKRRVFEQKSITI